MRKVLAALLCLGLLIFPVHGSSDGQYVALTFDDGPSGQYTCRLLEGLEARNVKATFLLCGYRMKDYPRIANAIYQAGHEIGIHSYSHKLMGKMSKQQAAREISDTLALLPEGCEPVFFRTPGGEIGDGVKAAAKEAGFALLSWSVDPKDWAIHDAVAVEAAVVDVVRDGDIILLHDICDSSVDAALAIVDNLLSQGFQFVTVSELAAIKGIVPKPGKIYRYFR